jgi:UDP-N-acetylglucosamine 2-epimerase
MPHFHVEVGSGTHAVQTGGVMIAYEKVAMREKPDWIVVVGDVNSTAACAMVGTKLWIPVVHLEAGLRSGDRRMPEEINRLVTDAICDVYWTPSPDADEHLAREAWCRPQIVHTGQHYDANMSDAFFRDLGLPRPHFHLEVGSGTHAEQTGGVMIAYEKVAMRERPDWIVVVGDVNSTAACAMVGAKLWIPVIHLEAGLRSGDRRMPEEINRLATDAICDVYWTPSPDADEHLAREGVPESKIDRVGNIMIDSFEMMRGAIEADGTRAAMGLDPGHYAVVTLHRPSNVDTREALEPLVGQLVQVSIIQL